MARLNRLLHVAMLVFAVALMHTALAVAEPLPKWRSFSAGGCERFKDAGPRVTADCPRCKPGYQLSSRGECLRLGDFSSTRFQLFDRRLKRR